MTFFDFFKNIYFVENTRFLFISSGYDLERLGTVCVYGHIQDFEFCKFLKISCFRKIEHIYQKRVSDQKTYIKNVCVHKIIKV